MQQKELSKIQKVTDDIFTKYIHNLSPDLIDYVTKKVYGAKWLFSKKASFQLELIVDTNIIYAEVRSLMIRDSSFFLKIIDNPLIKIFAPAQLETELLEKIRMKFPKDKKTRHLNIDDCINKAKVFLSKIELRDDIAKSAHNKAHSIMKDRDKDDIPFVALNISLNSHGILTNDRDIKDQKEIKTWKLGEAGSMITEINKGSFSFLILNSSVALIFETILDITKIIWSSFISMVNNMIDSIFSILKGSYDTIKKISPEFLLLFGGFFGLAFIFLNEHRNSFDTFVSIIWVEIKKILLIIKNIFARIQDIFKTIFDALQPFLEIPLDVFTYFVSKSIQTITKLEELEMSRAEKKI